MAADVSRDAFGLQVRHAVERDRQRHAGLEQIGQLLREGRQLLEFGFALLLQVLAHGRRQELHPGRVWRRRFLRSPGCRAALGMSTAMGNKPSRSICTSAAPRSATSRMPVTTSPERFRAL